MLSILVVLAVFLVVAFLAYCGQEAPMERFSAVATQPLLEPPPDFVYSCSYERPLHYSSPVFADPYEEWHYYRHHLHPDEYLGDLRQRFMEEYSQGIFGLWDALRYGEALTAEQEDLANLLQLQLDQLAPADVIDGTWR